MTEGYFSVDNRISTQKAGAEMSAAVSNTMPRPAGVEKTVAESKRDGAFYASSSSLHIMMERRSKFGL